MNDYELKGFSSLSLGNIKHLSFSGFKDIMMERNNTYLFCVPKDDSSWLIMAYFGKKGHQINIYSHIVIYLISSFVVLVFRVRFQFKIFPASLPISGPRKT